MYKRSSLVPGLLISLLLHGGLLYLAVTSRYAPEQPVADAHRMLVRLVPQTAPAAAPQASGNKAGVAQAPPRAARRPSPPSLDGVSAPPEQPTAAAVAPASAAAAVPAQAQVPADPFAEPAAAAPIPGKFDANAALKSARKLATAKATRDDPPVAQIYDKPINPIRSGSELGRGVAGAARADCKTAAAGTGLLAIVIVPIMLLTDKKDSGCKW